MKDNEKAAVLAAMLVHLAGREEEQEQPGVAWRRSVHPHLVRWNWIGRGECGYRLDGRLGLFRARKPGGL